MKTFLPIGKYNIPEWLSICTAGFDTNVNECVYTAAFPESFAPRRVQRFNVRGKGGLQGAYPDVSQMSLLILRGSRVHSRKARSRLLFD